MIFRAKLIGLKSIQNVSLLLVEKGNWVNIFYTYTLTNKLGQCKKFYCKLFDYLLRLFTKCIKLIKYMKI